MNIEQRVAQCAAALQLPALNVIVGSRLGLEGLGRRELDGFVDDNAAVAVFAAVVVHSVSDASGGLRLALELHLDSDRLHFVHLGDRLTQVVGKLAPIVLVASVEGRENFSVDFL